MILLYLKQRRNPPSEKVDRDVLQGFAIKEYDSAL